MKSEALKTVLFVTAAAALTVTAAWIEPETRRPGIFSDQGEVLFPQLRDVTAVKGIEVVDFDEALAAARPLKVEFRKGRWVLVSHSDYPAEAKDRLAKTAASLVDVKKDLVVSDRVEDHATYGVIDPLDQKVVSLKGRGKRVTLRGAAGEMLADVIEGYPVKGRPGFRYVRLPGQKRTYAVKTDADPSAKFGDWVEANLLHLTPAQIQKITINSYSINPDTGRVGNLDRKSFTPADAGFASLAAALASIRVTGARAKPPSLAKQLREHKGLELTLESVMSLRSRGFFITPEGRLLANEGEMTVETTNGVAITIRFGETDGENRTIFITAAGKTPEAQQQAEALDARFADWYYLISQSDFKRLRR
jgi:hypothetical protein